MLLKSVLPLPLPPYIPDLADGVHKASEATAEILHGWPRASHANVEEKCCY